MKALLEPSNRAHFLMSVLAVFFLLTSCNQDQSLRQGNTFDFETAVNHQDFDSATSKFTFAVFSDLTGGERPGIFDVAVAQLNLLRPELIVNVGDLIEGSTRDSLEWHRQWDEFDRRAGNARAPVFYTGGNHDLTGMLARNVWEARLGQRYYHFVYKNVLFMILDTEDHTPENMDYIERIRLEALKIFDEEGREAYSKTAYAELPERKYGYVSPEQAAYFSEAVEKNSGVSHAFLFIHKPVWDKPGEENFRNIESSLDDLPYTVFHGHTHQYRHTERFGRDYINLATTGGSQNPSFGWAADQIALVTVDREDVSIANILLEGILDKTGKVPLSGDTLTFGKRN